MDKIEILKQIAKEVKEHKCSLREGCIQPVPGEGNPNNQLVFIGEAPGKREDEQGKPFVGPAGKLLDKLLDGIGFKREDVYITNVVKCRPPGNRDPSLQEIAEHSEFLKKELEVIKPKLIVLLGRHALNRFLPNEKISECRGKAKRYNNQVYFAVYHPAAALHNPNLLGIMQEDFKKIPILLKEVDKLAPQIVNNPEPELKEEMSQEILL